MPDVKDQPILDATISSHSEIMISNDSHFLSIASKVDFEILKAGEFFAKFVDNAENMKQIQEILCEYEKIMNFFKSTDQSEILNFLKDDRNEKPHDFMSP